FFPRGFDPVLNGGGGDEDAVITPQVPTGGLVGEIVLGHQADGHLLDTTRVVAVGRGQVGEVSGKETVAMAGVVTGEGDQQVDGMATAGITQVVHGAVGDEVTASAATTTGTTAGAVVAAAAFIPGLGESSHRGDAFGDVGDVLTWSEHGSALLSR